MQGFSCLYSKSSQRRGAQSCMECQGGRLCNHTGLSQSSLCPTGHYCPPGSSVARPCPPVSIVSMCEVQCVWMLSVMSIQLLVFVLLFICVILVGRVSFYLSLLSEYELHFIQFHFINVVKWYWSDFSGLLLWPAWWRCCAALSAMWGWLVLQQSRSLWPSGSL